MRFWSEPRLHTHGVSLAPNQCGFIQSKVQLYRAPPAKGCSGYEARTPKHAGPRLLSRVAGTALMTRDDLLFLISIVWSLPWSAD
jgi:hypothetical protein